MLFVIPACQTKSVDVSSQKVGVDGGAYTNVGPAELNAMLKSKDFLLINVHIPLAGDIADTDLSIPYDEIGQNLSRLPADKNARIVLYCRSGRMSAIAAETLVKLGYTDIWNLQGGMDAWEQAGFPIRGK
jgi:rhodanese-related sulfurtransferase